MIKQRIALIIGSGLFVLLATVMVAAQNNEIDPGYQTTPTVVGGTSTGLFNTLGTRTLKRGEFTFGVFWNNYDRDPGDLDITQIPVNFGIGLTDRWEVFANIDLYQQVTTRQPFALSGTQFNGIRSAFGGDPLVAFGQPVGGRDGAAAFFPFSGALSGGILPPLGSFFGPQFVTDRPSFYNDLPFFGPAVFNPQTGTFDVRQSANGTGNITLGTKFNLVNPDRGFSLAIAGLLRVPTVRHYHGLANGRGAGEIDFGPILILGQSMAGHRLRFTENIGYIHSGDPGNEGVKILDRRDQFLLNAGVEVAAHQQLVLVGELDGTVYIGSGTPNLNPVNPLDLVVGLRYFAFDGNFHLGVGWRRLLNQSNDRKIPGFVGTNPSLQLFPIGSDDVNGFVVSLGIGRRVKRIPPSNQPPTVNLEADKTNVMDGQTVNIFARASDPDNDVLDYTWSKTAGQINGTGPQVILDTTGVNPSPGAPPVEVIVSAKVDDMRSGTATSSVTIIVNAPTLPPSPSNRPPVIDRINSTVIGTPQVPGQITDGEMVRITGVANDPDGDPLTYTWKISAGQWSSTGSQVTLNTVGVTAGPGAPPSEIIVNLTVSDGRGGTDSASTKITVHTVKKAEPERVAPDLEFRRSSARVDNVHKAVLDDIALRLQQDPGMKLVIDGFADQDEPNPAALARGRAENVEKYLVREKGIDPTRIIVRSFGTERPHPSGDQARNRRVELWIVPLDAEMPK